jgi:hypothetical protein
MNRGEMVSKLQIVPLDVEAKAITSVATVILLVSHHVRYRPLKRTVRASSVNWLSRPTRNDGPGRLSDALGFENMFQVRSIQ